MLKIRLSRTGKNTQPTFRLIVQEHTAPIKGKFVEEIGYYRPTTPEKPFNINSERVKHWISVGARPSDTVATLLKKQGFEGMEQYMEPRDKKRKKKKDQPASSASEASTSSEKKAEAKKEEPATAPSASEASASNKEKAEAKTEETATAPEAPAEDPAPAPENAKSEEATAHAEAKAEAPAEEPQKSES